MLVNALLTCYSSSSDNDEKETHSTPIKLGAVDVTKNTKPTGKQKRLPSIKGALQLIDH
jgi:hypothetical protein